MSKIKIYCYTILISAMFYMVVKTCGSNFCFWLIPVTLSPLKWFLTIKNAYTITNIRLTRQLTPFYTMRILKHQFKKYLKHTTNIQIVIAVRQRTCI